MKKPKHDHAPSPEEVSAVQAFVCKVSAEWQKATESIIATGHVLLRAQEELRHGQFLRMISQQNKEKKLPFGERTAQMLMKIAAHPVISNPKFISVLPPSWATLYAMTKIPHELLEALLLEGTINADTKGKDVQALLKKLNDDGLGSAKRLYEALKYLILFQQKGPGIDAAVQMLMGSYKEQDGVSVTGLGGLSEYFKELHRAYEEKATEFDASYKEDDELWDAARAEDENEDKNDDGDGNVEPDRDGTLPVVHQERVRAVHERGQR
jgi:hypothetical protein